MRHPSSSRSKQGAFTLLEVMLVIICLAAITAMASQAINTSITKSQTVAREALLQQITSAKSRFVLDNIDNQQAITDYNYLMNGADWPNALFGYLAPYMVVRGKTPQNSPDMMVGTGAAWIYPGQIKDANNAEGAPTFGFN